LTLESSDLVAESLVLLAESVIRLLQNRDARERRVELRLELSQPTRLFSDTERLLPVDALKVRDAEVFGVGEDLRIEILSPELSTTTF
jgi:hypothetical protein